LEELTFINASDGNLPMEVRAAAENGANKAAAAIAQATSKWR